jgi:hypothetical protein
MMGAARGGDLRSIQTLFVAGSITGMTDGQLLEHFLTGKGKRSRGSSAGATARTHEPPGFVSVGRRRVGSWCTLLVSGTHWPS